MKFEKLEVSFWKLITTAYMQIKNLHHYLNVTIIWNCWQWFPLNSETIKRDKFLKKNS